MTVSSTMKPGTISVSTGIYSNTNAFMNLVQVDQRCTLTDVWITSDFFFAGVDTVAAYPVVYANGASVNLAAGSASISYSGSVSVFYQDMPLLAGINLTPGVTYAIGALIVPNGSNTYDDDYLSLINPSTVPYTHSFPGTLPINIVYQGTSAFLTGASVPVTGPGCTAYGPSGGVRSGVAGPKVSGTDAWAIGYTISSNPIPSLPGAVVQLSFTPPFETPSWVNISDSVRSFTTTAGRQHELLVTQASQAQVTVDNRDARFNPWNTTGMYASVGQGLTPTIGLQILGNWENTQYPIFTGFVDSFTPRWDNPMSTDMVISATDLLGIMATDNMSSTAYPTAVLGNQPAGSVSGGLLTGPDFYWRGTPVIDGTLVQDFTGNYNATPIPAGGITFGGTGALPMDVMASMDFATGCFWQFPTTQLYDDALTVDSSVPSITLECWIQQQAEQTAPVTLMGLANGGGSVWSVVLNQAGTGKLSVNYPGTSGASVATTSAAGVWNDGNWHHLVMVVGPGNPSNPETVFFYQDGVAFGSVTFTTGAAYSLISALLKGTGYIADSANEFSMQEIAIYPWTLTNADIEADYVAAGGLLFAAQTSGNAIVNALTLAGIPSDLCALVGNGGAIDTGLTLVQPPGGGSLFSAGGGGTGGGSAAAQSLTSIDATSYAQTYGTAESGFLFVNPSGVLTLYDRHYPVTGTGTPAASSQATFEDASTSSYFYLVDGFVPSTDNLDLWNEVIAATQAVTGDDFCTGALQVYEDTAAQALYGKRSYPQLTDLLCTTDVAALGLAQWLGFVYNAPLSRVAAIKTSSWAGVGAGSASVGVNVPQMLGRALWDQITVIYHGLVGGTAFTQLALIEGIEHTYDADPGQWQTVFRLSPAEAGNAYIILNDTTFGKLSSGNSLAY